MEDVERTRWDLTRGQAAEATAARILAKGLLDEARVHESLAEYLSADPRTSFTSWLVEKGLLGLQDLPLLQEGEEGAAAHPDAEVAIGARFSGCTIEKKLGQGGMGIVYRARRDADGLPVVIKFLLPEHLHDATWKARFLREAFLLRGLDCPQVVRVHSVEVEGDRPHIVMELVEGHDLEDQLAESGRLAPLEAARIARDVALGLAAAHAHGVIHRDIKPGNVRIGPRGQVKILDFGLAKNLETDTNVSIAGQILGTPYYMAPEQWGDHAVDARCDVYSLGAMLYHLVTGQVPFPGTRVVAIRRAALEGVFPRPRSVAPEVPEDLELAILRMMAYDRRVRPPTAARCAEHLQLVLEGKPVPVPCLVEQPSGRRHALLPGISFAVGSDPACAVRVESLSVAPHHATLELGANGYQIHQETPQTPILVAGMHVASTLLRPGDVVRLGEVELEFQDGGVGATLGSAWTGADRREVTQLPDAFVEALVAAGDRRVVLGLIESLSLEAIEARVASTRLALLRLLDGPTAEEGGRRYEARLRHARSEAVGALFRITHENLGDDLEAWLRWWDEAGSRYPPQVAAYRIAPRARLRIVAGEDEPRVVPLDDRAAWVLGRATEADVQLRNVSVSRKHATLRRIHDRFVLRDEGSRFGVRVNGTAASHALLRPGDRIALAKVVAVFDADDLDAAPPRSEDACYVVCVQLLDALAELGHPSVALALARFASAPARLQWVARTAARLAPEPGAARALEAAVTAIYAGRARDAAALLPRVVPALAGASPEEWEPAVERLRPDLPPQLLPIAWFPERRRTSPAAR